VHRTLLNRTFDAPVCDHPANIVQRISGQQVGLHPLGGWFTGSILGLPLARMVSLDHPQGPHQGCHCIYSRFVCNQGQSRPVPQKGWSQGWHAKVDESGHARIVYSYVLRSILYDAAGERSSLRIAESSARHVIRLMPSPEVLRSKRIIDDHSLTTHYLLIAC
jgi:hypothetical protein